MLKSNRDDDRGSHVRTVTHSYPKGIEVTCLSKPEDNDDEDDDEEDEEEEERDEDEEVAGNDESCLASDEFEWMRSSPAPISRAPNRNLIDETPQPKPRTASAPPLLRPHRQSRRSLGGKVSTRKFTRSEGYSSSPSPTNYRASPSHYCDSYLPHGIGPPVRASWCCSPPPPPCCHHRFHGSGGMEVIPYTRDYCDDYCHSFGYSAGVHPCLPTHMQESRPRSRGPDLIKQQIKNGGRVSPAGPYTASTSVRTPRVECCSAMEYRDICGPAPWTHPFRFTPHSWKDIYKPNIQNGDFDEMQEKVHRMETDKENLLLQVSVLTEQVEVQNEKIGELENLILNKKSQLTNTEELLQQEIITRSTLESNKLEIITEMSNLRLKLTNMERDRRATEEKCRKAETELVLLHAQLAEKEAELATLRTKFIKNEPKNLSDEAQKLKRELDSIAEKDKKIEELKAALNKCKKLQDTKKLQKEMSPNSDQLLAQDYRDSPFPSSSVAEAFQKLSLEPKLFEKPPPVPRHNTSLVSTPVPSDPSPSSWKEISITKSSPSPSPVCVTDNSPVPPMKHFQRSNSAEDISQQPQKTPPLRSQYGTIPRQHGADVLQQLQQQLQQHDLESASVPGSNSSTSQLPTDGTSNSLEQTGKKESFQTLHHPSLGQFRPVRGKSSGVSFGKGFFKLRKGKRSSSAPELAQQESVIPETELDSCQSALSLPVDITPIVMPKEKNKGLKKIFGKWKRSGSHSLDRGDGEFKRGGVRATAGPRLGWSKDLINVPDLPFARWNTDMIVEWLHRMGLSMYVGECKRWVKNGEHLLKATSHEMEKEIGIKNTLHRKKLQLALRTVNPEGCDLPESANKWDFQWVVRWLDDIGLPQYKDAFVDARVDGRMLHFLTVDDLLALKVSNQLHHISIKRGIQILREKKFDLHCLIRRSLPEESKIHTPQEVSLWTNHRVMEWLRTVDLSEYAPNLRGSGVHGALMVYEPRFNADLLASVLNIPPTKTLLRRHLTTHFKEVVGSELMQQKREQETQSGYIPLTPSNKVKVIRRSQFGLKKKRGKGDEDYEEYICPMDVSSNNSGKQEKSSERHSDPLPRTEGNEVIFQEGKNLSSMSSTNV